jgi:hypothetical protein
MKPSIVPLGIGGLDVTHQLGDVKQALVESLPVFFTPVGNQGSFGIEVSSSVVELLWAQGTKGLKMENEMVVISHDGEAGELAEVPRDIVPDNSLQLPIGGRMLQGQGSQGPVGPIVAVITGGFSLKF